MSMLAERMMQTMYVVDRETKLDWRREGPSGREGVHGMYFTHSHQEMFLNSTHHQVVWVLRRDGTKTGIYNTVGSPRQGAFYIQSRRTDLVAGQAVHRPSTNNLDKVNKYEELIDEAIILHNQAIKRGDVVCPDLLLEANIPEGELNEKGALYIPELDVVITVNDNPAIVHPNSTAGKNLTKAYELDKQTMARDTPLPLLSYFLVDKYDHYPDFWLSTGKTVIKIPRLKSMVMEDGIYFEHLHQDVIVNHGGGVRPPHYRERVDLTDLEELELMGIYKSAAEAKAGGNRIAATKRLAEQRKLEIEEERLKIAALEQTYKREELKYRREFRAEERDMKREEHQYRMAALRARGPNSTSQASDMIKSLSGLVGSILGVVRFAL